jgi:hypothetical protein
LKITGALDRFFTWSDLAIQIYSLSTETMDVKRQTFQLAYDSAQFEIRKIQDRAPLDVQLSYDMASKDLNVQFVTEGFRPADLFQLTGSLERFNPYLLSSVYSNGSLTLNLEELGLRYSADLQIDPPEEILPFELSITSRLSGNEEILYVSPLSLDSSRGRLEFVGNVLIGNLLPSGLLRLDDFDLLGGQEVDATLRIDRQVQAVAVESSTLKLGQTSFDEFSLSLTPEDHSVRFSLAAALEADQELGSFSATGDFGWESGFQLNGEATVGKLPLNTLYRLIAPPASQAKISVRRLEQLSRYSLSITAGVSTDFSTFSVASEELVIIETEKPENNLRLKGSVTQNTVELGDIQLQWEDYAFRGDIAVEQTEETLEVSSLFWLQDIPYQLEVDYLPGQSVRISGSYGLEGYYLFNQTMVPGMITSRETYLWGRSFGLESENLPIAFKQGTMYATVDVAGLLGSDGALYTTASSVGLRNLPLATVPKNSLELAFDLNDDQLNLKRITYEDEFSSLTGGGIATMDALYPIKGSGEIALQSSDQRESYRSNITVEGTQIHSELEVTRVPLKRFGIQGVNGSLSGSIAMDGELPRPDLSIAVTLNDGRLNLDSLSLSLAAEYSQDSVELISAEALFLNHRISNGRGRFDIGSGEFQFQSDYRGEYFEQIVNLQVDLQGISGGLPWPLTLDNALENNVDGLLAFRGIQVDGETRPDWRITLAGEGGELTFDGGPEDSISGTVARDGRFVLNLDEPLPVRVRSRGLIENNQLDADFLVTSLDMRIINTMTPTTDIFTFTTGIARGNLRVFGPINDPDLVGYLDVRDAELKFSPATDTIKPLNGRLLFDGKSFTLPRTTSYSGGAKVDGEGFFYIDHWIPEGAELIFYVDEYPGVHIAYPFDPVFVDGYATGAVRVRTDPTTIQLDGRILANSCRIALLREEEESEESQTAVIPMFVDLDISTGRSVEFFWPAMNFPIVRTFARQGEEINLYVNEETSEFFLKGEVEIRGGEIFYFDRSFYLKQGSIAFEDRIDEFDPWIYAVAEIRERDLNNEEIKIYLEANNKLSLFSPRFYSEPSRPDVEILNLIGGTILNRFEQTDFGTAAVMLTSDIVGQFGILTPFERAVREVLNLDLFTVRTQFLQNVLIDKIRGENLVANPLDNTTLTLGKYLGTDLFLEALVRFQNVEDLTTSSNIRTEGELNLEWVTPFFLLEWTFTPTHPENLFLSDNSIGLSWKYSY